MSGLAALFHRDGRPVDRYQISAILAAAAYRGPDGMWTGLWASVALGFAKMATTPEEELEQQPLSSPRTGCSVIADVRLDNRAELLAKLPDRPTPTASDAELILRAYETWALDSPAHLLGDFAFVIWDPRHRRLVCARDTSGQRSLFYRADARTFAAASEIHQLLQDSAVPVVPNDERIRDFLTPFSMSWNEQDQAATFYAGIFALPAGHILTVDCDNMRVRRYWDLQPPAELRYRTDEEYAEHFRALFFDVVRARLRSSRPVGALLSGGLDSSTIVCTAQELFRRGEADDCGFTSFSSVFDGLECDERGFIEDIQAKYGFDARYVSCEAAGGRLQLEPRGFQESPNMGSSELRDAMCSAATQVGVRVLLTGDVADSCIAGSPLVFDSLLRSGRLGAFRRRLRHYRRTSGESLRKITTLYCMVPLLPLAWERRILGAYTKRVIQRHSDRLLPSWMPEALRDDLSQRHLRFCLEAERGRRFGNLARENEYRMLYPPETARQPVPWPVEIWRPFADRRLHEFLLAIPPEQKFEPHPETDEFYAGSKRLVRQAMRGILPEALRTRRSKTHFGATFESEMARRWPLYEAAFGTGSKSEVAARGYVDSELFLNRLGELRDGSRGGDFMYVLQVVGLESWLRALRLPRPELVTLPSPLRAFGSIREPDPVMLPITVGR